MGGEKRVVYRNIPILGTRTEEVRLLLSWVHPPDSSERFVSWDAYWADTGAKICGGVDGGGYGDLSEAVEGIVDMVGFTLREEYGS